MKKQFIALFAFFVFITMGKAQTIQYLPLFDDATFARSLNITDGTPPLGYSVGYTSGALDVSQTGGVSYTIPIALPPGTVLRVLLQALLLPTIVKAVMV